MLIGWRLEIDRVSGKNMKRKDRLVVGDAIAEVRKASPFRRTYNKFVCQFGLMRYPEATRLGVSLTVYEIGQGSLTYHNVDKVLDRDQPKVTRFAEELRALLPAKFRVHPTEFYAPS